MQYNTTQDNTGQDETREIELSPRANSSQIILLVETASKGAAPPPLWDFLFPCALYERVPIYG